MFLSDGSEWTTIKIIIEASKPIIVLSLRLSTYLSWKDHVQGIPARSITAHRHNSVTLEGTIRLRDAATGPEMHLHQLGE
ncbi:hypothetical protein THAOC_14630 [Thalassiosira oceanica]|uniref:Uncharacterized protein n=1 Tax=Thalassiosira oceanica TaxID=159749 RepID=K0T2G7_THAOC|nr:hypothetical protein THAOC_14630 [Thalassiosira oceanica]|eukprot:EJK64617.1 hypothetical protein THAOC_14630 [Thalassiosira oceanica]